jgi:hypothetical protein
MEKHRGFPGRLSGTDFQFIIRRANHKEGPTRIVRRERYADRRQADRRADSAFMAALWAHFGTEPFVRGNLDAGRLSWLIGREVVPATDRFDPRRLRRAAAHRRGAGPRRLSRGLCRGRPRLRLRGRRMTGGNLPRPMQSARESAGRRRAFAIGLWGRGVLMPA